MILTRKKSFDWILIAIVVALGTWPVFAQKDWVRFDGGVETSPGLGFTFTRASGVVGYDGGSLPPDAPRWHPPTLFCGPMDSLDLVDGRSINVLGAGVDTDTQTPVWVIRNATNMRLTIHTGEGSVEQAYLWDDWTGVYQLHDKDNSKGGIANLLVGQTGLNGGTPDRPDMAFKSSGVASVHHGLIVLNCEVLQDFGNGFRSARAALVYTTMDRLGEADPWIVAALGEPTDLADTKRGSSWSFSYFPVNSSELMAVWTDYRSSVKTGGACYATRFVYLDDSWSHKTVRIAVDDDPFLQQHFHTGGYIKHSDGRQSFFVSTGDGVGDNQMLATTLAFGGAWSDGEVVPGSGLGPDSVVYLPSNDWTPAEVVWGGKGEDPSLRHNQVIVMRAADPECSALICGGDETDATVLRLEYDPDLRRPTWTTLGLPTITSWPGDGVTAFTLEGVPGGPYLTRIDAASTSAWAAEDNLESRILFSPDGEIWGQCFTPRTKSSRPAVFVGDTAYIGAFVSDPVGLRRLTMPSWRKTRPLALAPSGDNLLRALVPTPTEDLDSGVQIMHIPDLQSLPAGVPPPPCDAGNIFLIDNDGLNGELGRWYLVADTASVTAPTESVMVRAWLWALGPEDADDPATTAQLAMRIRDVGAGRLNERLRRSDIDAGQWSPVTFWVPATGFGVDESWLPAVVLQTERGGGVYAPNRMLIAWEGFFQDAPTVQGNGLPPEQAGDGEHASIHGLALDEEWSIFVIGMVPFDQWDNRTGGSTASGDMTRCTATPGLFTIEQGNGAKQLSLTADPTTLGFDFTLTTSEGAASTTVVDEVVWVRGSPVLCLVRARDGEIVLDYSVGGSIPKRVSFAGSIAPDTLTLGPDAMLWDSVEALPYALPDQLVPEVFSALELRCRADFNRDGMVNTIDFIAFLNAWVAGESRADFNFDSSVDTQDVLAFLSAYAAGC